MHPQTKLIDAVRNGFKPHDAAIWKEPIEAPKHAHNATPASDDDDGIMELDAIGQFDATSHLVSHV